MRFALSLLALTTLASSCIVIVHEDDGRDHRDSREHVEAREVAVRALEVHEVDHSDDDALDDLNERVKILRTAREGHHLAGNGSCESKLEQGIHVGELQLEGASDGDIEEAFEGLTMEQLIECLEAAGIEWEASGCGVCAERCRALARHYAEREAS